MVGLMSEQGALLTVELPKSTLPLGWVGFSVFGDDMPRSALLCAGLLISTISINDAWSEEIGIAERIDLKAFETQFFKSNHNRWKANFVYVLLANTYEVKIRQMDEETDNQVFISEDNG